MRKLISLPDAKVFHPVLTIGKEYEVLREIGNGCVIETDDGQRIVVVWWRLQ